MRVAPELTRAVFQLLPLASSANHRFESKFDGVSLATLYRDPGTGASAALLRYQPGGHVPRHRHVGFEHIYVLQGAQSDEWGEYRAGMLIINPPGTEHWVVSTSGCLVLAIWQFPVEFVEV